MCRLVLAFHFTVSSAQLLLVDGRLSPAYLLPELALPRFVISGLSLGCLPVLLYMRLLRPTVMLLMRLLLLLPPVHSLAGCVYGVLVCNVQPLARGKLVVAESDTSRAPLSPLQYDAQYLGDEGGRDARVLFNAMNAARAMLRGQCPVITSSSSSGSGSGRSAAALPSFVEVLPGPLFWYTHTYAWFLAYARLYTTTYFHACGSCAMGAVVDEQLRVRGARGLRVCDASVIPRIPTAPTAATCMVLGGGLARLLAPSNGDVRK